MATAAGGEAEVPMGPAALKAELQNYNAAKYGTDIQSLIAETLQYTNHALGYYDGCSGNPTGRQPSAGGLLITRSYVDRAQDYMRQAIQQIATIADEPTYIETCGRLVELKHTLEQNWPSPPTPGHRPSPQAPQGSPPVGHTPAHSTRSGQQRQRPPANPMHPPVPPQGVPPPQRTPPGGWP
jgi:hypothetical protein